ncbi:hypothetical protein HAX54_015378, partial [Datura stramonium]|nr:hypothetical protein [Datura stramonium]
LSAGSTDGTPIKRRLSTGHVQWTRKNKDDPLPHWNFSGLNSWSTDETQAWDSGMTCSPTCASSGVSLSLTDSSPVNTVQ